MKLERLYEASRLPSHPNTQRAFNILRSVKKDAELNDLAWYAAYFQAQMVVDSYRTKDIAWLFMEGLPGLQDNPDAIEDFWAMELEMADEEGSSTADEGMAEQFKEFFGV